MRSACRGRASERMIRVDIEQRLGHALMMET